MQYKTLMLSILLYGCEVWTITDNMEKKIKPSKINYTDGY